MTIFYKDKQHKSVVVKVTGNRNRVHHIGNFGTETTSGRGPDFRSLRGNPFPPIIIIGGVSKPSSNLLYQGCGLWTIPELFTIDNNDK